MDLNKASWIAKQKMKEHGLSEDWVFRFSKSVNTLGFCSYPRKTLDGFVVKPGEIVLSLNHTVMGSEERVLNTILHEIAHALVGPHHDHDSVWREKAISIGCSGERCSNVAPEEKVERRYNIVCDVHGIVGQKAMHVRSARPRSCGKCSRVFDPRFLLKTVLNPKYVEQRRVIANAADRAF